jgi:hypothetical protein
MGSPVAVRRPPFTLPIAIGEVEAARSVGIDDDLGFARTRAAFSASLDAVVALPLEMMPPGEGLLGPAQ